MARQNRRLTRDARYGRYVDGPDPLAPPVDLTEALDAIGEDVMAGTSPERALSEFLRRGGRSSSGLDDLARRVVETVYADVDPVLAQTVRPRLRAGRRREHAGPEGRTAAHVPPRDRTTPVISRW